ncbi:ATP-binding cassette sub-family D member 4 [Nymphon striatum]|nr:ATP-binding cassette sub-family D member 4 [Nymphon striatum]
MKTKTRQENGQHGDTGWYEDAVRGKYPVWRGYGDGMETVWRRYGDGMETVWRRYGDGMETVWRRYGDGMETVWRRYGDGMETTFGVVGYEGLLAAYVFFFISGCINVVFMSPIVKATARQERCEGDFRFQHMHLRIHAESIAFQKSEKVEFSQVNQKLNSLTLAMQSLANRMYPLFFFTELAAYAENVISYLVVAAPIFAGKFHDKDAAELSSIISKNAFVLGYLLNCFVGILKITANISSIAGSTHRIAEVIEEIDKREVEERKNRITSHLQSTEKDDPNADQTLLEFKDITVKTPSESEYVKIVDNLQLTLKLNTNLLITGKGSCGKTSLLRVIRGLWGVEKGKIIHSSLLQEGPNSILYLPKVPLMTGGTLRQQIIYPFIIDKLNDEYLYDNNSVIQR